MHRIWKYSSKIKMWVLKIPFIFYLKMFVSRDCFPISSESDIRPLTSAGPWAGTWVPSAISHISRVRWCPAQHASRMFVSLIISSSRSTPSLFWRVPKSCDACVAKSVTKFRKNATKFNCIFIKWSTVSLKSSGFKLQLLRKKNFSKIFFLFLSISFQLRHHSTPFW